MTKFSRFYGDDNESLYKIQFSILHNYGLDSAIPLFLRESILRYKNCMNILEIQDEISQIIDCGCPYTHYKFTEFINVSAAYYRYLWGCQYHIPFPAHDNPETENEWIDHYKKFLYQEGKIFSESYSFFPDIIHLLAVQHTQYFYDLKDHLLFVMCEIYNKRVFKLFEKKITFLSSVEYNRLEQHEDSFSRLNRNEIIKLLQRETPDISEIDF